MTLGKTLALLLTLVAVPLLAPAAGATHLPSCAAVTDGAATPVGGAAYLKPVGTNVEAWTESNGLAGLQRADCHGPDGVVYRKDAHQGTYGTSTIPPVPNCVYVAGRHICIL